MVVNALKIPASVIAHHLPILTESNNVVSLRVLAILKQLKTPVFFNSEVILLPSVAMRGPLRRPPPRLGLATELFVAQRNSARINQPARRPAVARTAQPLTEPVASPAIPQPQ